MTRRKAAWLAALSAIVLAAGFLLARRGRGATGPAAPAPSTDTPEPSAALSEIPRAPEPSLTSAPVEAEPLATSEPAPVDVPTEPVPTPAARSWNTRRAAAAPPPPPEPEPVTEVLETPQDALVTTPDPVETAPIPAVPPQPTPESGATVEQPLATWIRVAIIGVALLAFFAVSLIATKQV